MRPRGEVREALARAAQALHVERGHFTWRELAERGHVGYEKARRTADDMAAGGELVRVGHAKTARGHWMTLFELAEPRGAAPPAAGDLERLFLAWRAP